jgi:nucleoside-diphosphate-sugar epimerase
MRILVTGGVGKLGQWVVEELLRTDADGRSHEVRVLDRVPGSPREGAQYLTGDIEDLGQVYGAMSGVDAVIHSAAVPRPGMVTDEATFRTNVMGTYNVHEAAYRLGVKRVVSVGSQAILGWDYRVRDFLPAYLPVDEDHPINPQDPYGLSKEVSESIARSFARKGLETVVLRPNRILTPDQLEQIALTGGRAPTKFTLCSYVDVRDMAVACRLAVEKPVPPGTVLFVVADDTAVSEPLCDILPRFMPAIADLARHLTGSIPAISNARAKDILGWAPAYSWRKLDLRVASENTVAASSE